MKFAPVPAAGIFTFALMTPPSLAVAIARSVPFALAIVILCPIAFGVFWTGARVAGRPHSMGSIALAVLMTWTFTTATNGLGKLLFGSNPYAECIDVLLQFAFVFMVARQYAPKVPASVQVAV